MKPKHVAKTMYYWLYIDVLWLNKILYEYWITQRDDSYEDWSFNSGTDSFFGGGGDL